MYDIPFLIQLVKADGTVEVRVPQPGEVIPVEPGTLPTFLHGGKLVLIHAPGAFSAKATNSKNP
jgi:hypothetical protein